MHASLSWDYTNCGYLCNKCLDIQTPFQTVQAKVVQTTLLYGVVFVWCFYSNYTFSRILETITLQNIGLFPGSRLILKCTYSILD